MPRRHRHRHRRTMKGGFLDDLTNTLSGWGSSITQGASSIWEKTKSASSNLTSPSPSTTMTPSVPSTTITPSSPSTTMTPSSPSSIPAYGGKHRTHKKRGGGVASFAASASNIKTAQPLNWVGGKTRRKSRRKHKKTRKN